MWYGCRFNINSENVVSSVSICTRANYEYESAKECLFEYQMMLDETGVHHDSNVGFAVIHLDESGCVAEHFYLDDKFLVDDDLLDQIKISLESMTVIF